MANITVRCLKFKWFVWSLAKVELSSFIQKGYISVYLAAALSTCLMPYSDLNQLFLLFWGHLEQWVIFAGQISRQSSQGVHQTSLYLSPLRPGDSGRQAQTADTTPGTDTARPHVLLVELTTNKLEPPIQTT